MSEFCFRLREERERLGMTQAEVGELVDTSKRTVHSWEQGVSSPNAIQLGKLRQRGFDALYLLSGSRPDDPVHTLTEQESEWLSYFRNLTGRPEAQQLLLGFMRFTQPPKEAERALKTVLLTAMPEARQAYFSAWLGDRCFRVERGDALSRRTDYVLFDDDDQLDEALLTEAARQKIPVIAMESFQTVYQDLSQPGG